MVSRYQIVHLEYEYSTTRKKSVLMAFPPQEENQRKTAVFHTVFWNLFTVTNFI